MRQYCDLLTKEDCRRQSGSFIACEKVSDKDSIILFFYFLDFITLSISVCLNYYADYVVFLMEFNLEYWYLHFLLVFLDMH